MTEVEKQQELEKQEKEKVRRGRHRRDRLLRNEDDVELVKRFKKMIKVDQKPGSNSDMIKCPKCGKAMGIKKWARLVSEDKIICPGCCTEYKPDVKVKIVLKEKSRFKVDSAKVDKSKSLVTIDPDGTKHYKETVNVNASPYAAAKK